MARLLQDKVKKPLAGEILFGKLEHGGTVKITVRDDELHFVFKPRPATPKPSAKGGKGSKKTAVTVGSGREK